MAIRGYIDASVKILADDMNAPHLLDEGGVTDVVSENVGDIIEDRAEEIFNEELHPETVAAVQAIAGGGGGGIVYTAGEGIDITGRVISVSDDFQEQVVSAQNTADAAIETANEANSTAMSANEAAAEASGEAASAATIANQALEAVNGKQDMLIAGEGITIEDNVISATGGGGGGGAMPVNTYMDGIEGKGSYNSYNIKLIEDEESGIIPDPDEIVCTLTKNQYITVLTTTYGIGDLDYTYQGTTYTGGTIRKFGNDIRFAAGEDEPWEGWANCTVTPVGSKIGDLVYGVKATSTSLGMIKLNSNPNITGLQMGSDGTLVIASDFRPGWKSYDGTTLKLTTQYQTVADLAESGLHIHGLLITYQCQTDTNDIGNIQIKISDIDGSYHTIYVQGSTSADRAFGYVKLEDAAAEGLYIGQKASTHQSTGYSSSSLTINGIYCYFDSGIGEIQACASTTNATSYTTFNISYY